jgi:hypothetical protein
VYVNGKSARPVTQESNAGEARPSHAQKIRHHNLLIGESPRKSPLRSSFFLQHRRFGQFTLYRSNGHLKFQEDEKEHGIPRKDTDYQLLA